jgi:glycosyltransferase involved in cell wall biosynthesis
VTRASAPLGVINNAPFGSGQNLGSAPGASPSRGFRFTLLAVPGQLDGLDMSGVEIELLRLPPRMGRRRVPLRVLYELVGLPLRARRFDLLYCIADISPPFASTPTVVLLRNLNIYDRTWYDDRRTRMLARLASWGARRVRLAVFPTRAAADLIRVHLPMPEERVRIVHYGIDLDVMAAGAAVESERPFLFLPAALEKHKNIDTAVRALALCSNPALELWLAGTSALDSEHRSELLALAEQCGVGSRVRALGAIPYRELLGYYRAARALIFPSYIETFGHPVLEAMAAGTPMVLSDIPAFREIAGDRAALFFPPRDARALARCIDRLADDAAATRNRVEEGARRVRDFSWRASVDGLCHVFEEALRA